jgi:ribosomal-protein-alanine N-acetyltransferase
MSDAGMVDAESSFIVEPMSLDDVPQVMEIERQSFPLPWPERAYRYELTQNQNSHYVVLRCVPAPGRAERRSPLRWLWQRDPRPPILGYGGFWMIAGEAHISTIAVATAWRKRGLGELLLWSMLMRAAAMRAFEATLEVRVSNHVAQRLYHKYGFEEVGRRRRYYQDNGEDALIMTVCDFDSRAYQTRLTQLGAALQQRLRQRAKE